MLISTKRLESATVNGVNQKVGKVKAFLFEEGSWAVRYLSVHRGFAFFGKRILVPPEAVTLVLGNRDVIETKLDKDTIAQQVSAWKAAPVSKRMKRRAMAYYGLPAYWGGASMHTSVRPPIVDGALGRTQAEVPNHEEEARIRSSHELTGYSVNAGSTYLGKLRDFLVDDETWKIQYMRVSPAKGAESQFLSRDWIDEVNWPTRQITLDVDPEELLSAPKLGSGGVLERSDEAELSEYLRRQAG